MFAIPNTLFGRLLVLAEPPLWLLGPGAKLGAIKKATNVAMSKQNKNISASEMPFAIMYLAGPAMNRIVFRRKI